MDTSPDWLFFLACRDCDPGIEPIQFDSPTERAEWRDAHTRDTGHTNYLVRDHPADEWD